MTNNNVNIEVGALYKINPEDIDSKAVNLLLLDPGTYYGAASSFGDGCCCTSINSWDHIKLLKEKAILMVIRRDIPCTEHIKSIPGSHKYIFQQDPEYKTYCAVLWDKRIWAIKKAFLQKISS